MEYAGKNTADGIPGIPSGLVVLDRVTGGWQNSNLIVIGGDTGMGCTSLLLTFMRNATTDFKRGVAFFSLQMSARQLLTKWLSLETELPFEKINSGNLTGVEMTRINFSVQQWDGSAGCLAMIDDTPSQTIEYIMATCRQLKEEGTELFLIDNINRIILSKESRSFCATRDQELSYIIRQLKTLSLELDLPIIVVSQLSRSVSTQGGDKKPRLTHLRDSGVIESEADLIVFVYRPEAYGITEDEMGNPTNGIAELIIAKNRFGDNESMHVSFVKRIGRFKDLEEDSWPASFTDEWSASFKDNYSASSQKSQTIRLGSRMDEPPF